jgi:rubrerythrin
VMSNPWDWICEHCGVLLIFVGNPDHVVCPLCGVDLTALRELERSEKAGGGT